MRSSAKDRRLRQRRSDARIRLRLAADAVLLHEHHASAVPILRARPGLGCDKVVALLEQLVAQQGALFDVIAGMSGWQAGILYPPVHGATSAEVPADGGNAWKTSSSVPSGVWIPIGQTGTTSESNAELREAVTSPTCGTGGMLSQQSPTIDSVPTATDVRLPHARVLASVEEGGLVGSFWREGEGKQLVGGAPVTFQQFIESDHYDCFKADLTVEQMSFLETFRHDDFPIEWDLNDILARVLSWRPYNPDLLGFSITDFYMLAMIRSGGIGWDRFGDDFPSMTPHDKDAVLVDFVKRKCVSGSSVASVDPGI